MRTTPPLPLTRDLVMIGGGHAHALALRRWAMAPLPGVRVTVINPDPTAPYTGMLPGHIAGHYDRAALEIDLVRLTRFAGARLVLGRATALDRAARRVTVPGRGPIAYDIASIDIGITSAMPEVPGFADHAVAAKPLGGYAARWADFVAAVARGARAGRVAVLGGGVAGVELALAMAERLRAAGARAAEVTVIEAGPAPLPGLGRGAQAALAAHMDRLGVRILCDGRADRVTADGVVLDDGRHLAAEFVLGAAGARPQPWLADTGLHLTDGYVTVDDRLRSVSEPAVFAVGDCAHMAGSPRPKAGVFAVRQAPVLYHNLCAALSGSGPMRRYRPQRDFLKLISTGGRGAVADKWGLRLDGAALWRWKDRIDRRFMAKFRDFPPMPAPALPARTAAGLRAELARGKPLCGGCGSKVGRAGLVAAVPGFGRLPEARTDVLTGPGDDAAVLAYGKGRQVISTDHLRAFTEDPWLMGRIAAIHALGDIWAMGAAPQAALATVILPRMAADLQARTLAEIMDGAGAVIADAGAVIAGGHTSQGSELVVGFTVTGLAPRVVAKGGAQPGDALVLTKALGTGVILAAEMVQAAPGGVVAGAWAAMARPVHAAADILRPEATAMTDVTGFGLAGHLVEMLVASGTAARLALGALPVLPGAEALAAAGHAATIAPENRGVADHMDLPDGPGTQARCALLFDPQTSGGLLAAVPGARAADIVARLHASGETEAAIIGTVTRGGPFITVVEGMDPGPDPVHSDLE